MADVGPLLARDSADAGARGGAAPSAIGARSPYADTGIGTPYVTSTNGSISGVVKELGVVQAGKTIRAYDRVTGEFLNQTVSAGDGSFSLNCKGRTKIYAVALDLPYNALIWDNVIPV